MKKSADIGLDISASPSEQNNLLMYFWEDVDVAYIKNELVNNIEVWKIFSSDGLELAVADSRECAFILAKQNDFEPKSAH